MAYLWRILAILALGTAARAADVLVYRDGDRVQGRLVGREAGMIVFASPRFGELRVPESEATVESTGPESAASGQAVLAEPTVKRVVPPSSPALAWWKPWKGRLALTLQWLSDEKTKRDLTIEARAERTWKNDEVRLDSQYDLKRANGSVTEDFSRSTGYWRHDLPSQYFTLYAPVLEWDRNYTGFAPAARVAKYVLTQQQAGFGYEFVDTEKFDFRAGVAENWIWIRLYDPVMARFDMWFESAFIEAEFKLPWQIELRERGQYYFYHQGSDHGWDNSVELSKQLTQLFSLTLRHEYRSNRPSLKGSDYNKLRLLLGLDF